VSRPTESLCLEEQFALERPFVYCHLERIAGVGPRMTPRMGQSTTVPAFGRPYDLNMETLVDRLRTWDDPAVRYQARLVLDGLEPDTADMRTLAEEIRASRDCRAVIEGGFVDPRHPYRKWQGAHWVLVQLAERGHPGGDPRLEQIQEIVFSWILSPAFLKPNWTLHVEGQHDRVRRCASMEGNVLWASLQLGLIDDRLRALADRLGEMQWPDGGWNCDVRPQARRSSFVETVLGLRGLAAWVHATGDASAGRTLERGVGLLLEHQLLFHRNGDLIVPNWGPPPDRIGFPIRFFDVLLVLELMADIDRLDDPRCERALDLLLSKRTPDGGFPMEVRRARTAGEICSNCTFAGWGPGGKTRTNPWVTIRALRVLEAAGRRK